MATLQIVSGPQAGQSVELDPGTVLEIGRNPPRADPAPNTSFLVLDDRRASRLHCRLRERADGRWVVEDCGSSNGTYVNATRTERKALERGDLIHVGGSVLGWEIEGAPLEELDDPGRRRSLRGLSLALGAVAVLAGLAVYLAGPSSRLREVVSPRGREERPPQVEAPAPEPPVPVTARTEKTGSPPERPERLGIPEAIPTEPVPQPIPDIEAYIAEGRYREGGIALDDFGIQHPDKDLSSERRRLLEAVRVELDKLRREVERLCAEGNLEEAYRRTEGLSVRVPADLADDALALLGMVARAEGERMAKEEKARQGRGLEVQKDLEEDLEGLRARWSELLADDPARAEPWDAFSRAVKGFVAKWRGEAAYRAHRREVRDLFIAGRKKSLLNSRKAEAFRATRVGWDGNTVILSYDFASPAELADFVPVGESPEPLRLENGGLRLRGELRLARGEPFRDRLVVRGTLRRGGYDPGAPNLSVALFTAEADRLTRPGGQARSLLAPVGAPADREPQDLVVFGLGYRTATEEYGGQQWEHLRIAGKDEPVPLPAHVVLTGWRGRLLHTDPREGLWALPLHRPLRGPLRFEVSLDGEGAAWKLNGRTLVEPEAEALERVRDLPRRLGSVTLFTQGSSVLLDSLEVEGAVSLRWLGVAFGFGAAAGEAFDALDPGGR
jgi:hypothetical protein